MIILRESDSYIQQFLSVLPPYAPFFIINSYIPLHFVLYAVSQMKIPFFKFNIAKCFSEINCFLDENVIILCDKKEITCNRSITLSLLVNIKYNYYSLIKHLL